ncbi:hypothetical protein Q5N85_19475, partial [Acinetobacter baumannii]|nr:hypothetical protein [Acinetobacter baumannii]
PLPHKKRAFFDTKTLTGHPAREVKRAQYALFFDVHQVLSLWSGAVPILSLPMNNPGLSYCAICDPELYTKG